MIKFQEHSETGYAMRTWDNARLSDLTIAFAIDFTTPGEILTRKAAYGKYHGINFNVLLGDDREALTQLSILCKKKNVKSINVAGNGIYTLSKLEYVQEGIDDLIWWFFRKLNLLHPLISVRSGGQTGVDEAALKAGDKLGLETICLAPKNWMFRNIEGRDICSESLFVKRFGPQYDITDIL